ncbi:hypothetical protein HU200_061137 [Digitaria exilis]|uniref:Speckle-type POZ protein n=1 Tax=Digitaria exilis TaxID=1010633 RepID=A0A835AHT0_9POAL|nr:hypothetical protein HU200_061137 [Digitaria exilis]
MSTCTTPRVCGQHTFTIKDYTFSKGLGVGKFVRSMTFSIGGFEWSIRYYPDGINAKYQQYISLSLELMSTATQVRAIYAFRLKNTVHQSEWSSVEEPTVFNSESIRRRISNMEKFLERSHLEESSFLESDNLVIECSIIILKKHLVSDAETTSETVLPPSELSKDFEKLLESKQGSDVTFSVKGESFLAHRIVLAARSPVFMAELCGPWKEKEALCITVEDMEPNAFKALLQYIYTDRFLPSEEYDDNDKRDIVHHLLQAADRYSIEKLKLACENFLCKNLDVETVTATLALADQHGCNNLKDACLRYIASPDKMEKVMATEEYGSIKRKFPNLLVEILEGVCKFRKI